MHVYIYDSYVSEKKYDHTMARIETRITDLGLNGKINRLNVMTNVVDTITNEIKRGTKTIIAIGNDGLLNKVINSIAKLKANNLVTQEIPLGFIPVGKKNNHIAHFLGIELEEQACDILSSRRIHQLDLGLANDNYFFSHASISTRGTTIEIDQDYSIDILEEGEISVVNLPIEEKLPDRVKPKVNDGALELLIKTEKSRKYLPIGSRESNQSVFTFKNLIILNKKIPVLIDNSFTIPTPVNIKIAPEKITMIVGKDRKF